MRLSQKLALLLVILSLLIVAAVGYFAFVSSQKTIEDNTRNHVATISLLKEGQVNNWIDSNKISLQNIAKRPLINDLMAQLLETEANTEAYHAIYDNLYNNHLTQLTEDRLGFRELFILHPETGQIVVSSEVGHVGRFRENQPYFQAGQTTTFVQNPYYLLSEQRQIITIATPLFGTDGALVGVLAGNLNFDMVTEIMLQGFLNYQTGDSFLVNKFNFFVTESRFDQITNEGRALHTVGVNDCLQGNTGTQIYENHAGTMVIGAYRWIAARELCLLTEVHEEEAFEPVIALRNNILLISSLIAAISAGIGLVAASTITTPIEHLVEGADVIGQGNLDHKVGTTARDEIGQLSRAFDMTVHNLKKLTASRDELDQEVSIRVEIEEQLRQRERILALSLDAAGAGVWKWDIPTGEMHWDIKMERIHGLEPGTFGKTYESWQQFVHTDDIINVERAFNNALAGVKQLDTTFRIICTNGEIRYVLAQAHVVKDTDGAPIQMVGINIDITERKESEQALELLSASLMERVKELQGLRDIGSYENENLSLHDYFKRIVKRIPQSMQYPEECVVAIRFEDQIYGDADVLELPSSLTKSIMVDGQKSGLLLVGYTKSLGFLPEEMPHIHAIADRIGQYISRRRLAEELQKTVERLEASNQELQQFAYVASHDLQEPLRMVTSYLQLFEKRYKGQIDDKADQFIYFAVDGARRMRSLINDLLTFSRVSSRGKEFAATDFNGVLSATLQDLEVLITETNTSISSAPLPTIMADESQMRQLFLNLISNGIKFRRDSPPEICVQAKCEDQHWVFSISDNGIGISPEYHEKIFVIFQRLHGHDEYEGTGIGLAVCKRIVERHGGTIWLESVQDEGTTFYFTIPNREKAQHQHEAN